MEIDDKLRVRHKNYSCLEKRKRRATLATYKPVSYRLSTYEELNKN